MELNVLEKKDDRLKIEVVGESHTLLNILTEKCWEAGALQAHYLLEHPYLVSPKIVVRSENPKKTMLAAAKMVADAAKEFEAEFKRAVKK